MAAPAPESRGHEFPPLWAVPVLLIAAIMVAVYLGTISLGLLGFVLALVAVWWLQHKADAYVRARDSARTD